MGRFGWATLLSILVIPPAISRENYSLIPTERLITELSQVNSETPGIDARASFEVFMATARPPRFGGGILAAPTPEVPPQMRELVRRGVAALPYLLRHLTDARPTRLLIRNPISIKTFGGTYFQSEYEPRKSGILQDTSSEKTENQNEVTRPYRLRVGDLCFVLIGQIVNRPLLAVRYQPTALVFINSPVHSPSLAHKTWRDWQGLTREQHEASLLADLHDRRRSWLVNSALARLRFYYPAAYARLSGSEGILRAKFEADEQKDSR